MYKNEINICKCTDISLKKGSYMVVIPWGSPKAHEVEKMILVIEETAAIA